MSLLVRLKSILAGPAPVIQAVAPEPKDPFRTDGWVNTTLGYGYGYDKTSKTEFCPTPLLDDATLSNLYYGDAIAATIVDCVPDHAFRRGFKLESKEDEERAEEIKLFLEDVLQLSYHLKETVRWSRCYGGALLIPGVNDGASLGTPKREGAGTGIQWLQTVDKRYATVNRWATGLFQTDSSRAEIWGVMSLTGGITWVHESRVFQLDGVQVDPVKRRELNGWGMSVLQRPWERLKEFMTAFQSTNALLADASQGVFKLKDLWKQVAEKGRKALQSRMMMVDMTRSSSRSILLDSEGEDFTRVATQFSGVPDLLDRYMMFLSATTGIPVSILFGRSAAGMNATGENDVRAFYDKISAFQDTDLTPIVKAVIRDQFGDNVPSDLEVCWLPLWEPTEKEKADTCLTEAQTEKSKADEYAVWISSGVLHAEEVAIAVFSEEGTGEVMLDAKAVADRKTSLEASVELALDPPAPVDPNAPPAPQGEVNGETTEAPPA